MFLELIPPRARPRVLMHVRGATNVDHGRYEDLGKPMCTMWCRRCGDETDWLIFDTISEAERGIPCPKCNAGPLPTDTPG